MNFFNPLDSSCSFPFLLHCIFKNWLQLGSLELLLFDLNIWLWAFLLELDIVSMTFVLLGKRKSEFSLFNSLAIILFFLFFLPRKSGKKAVKAVLWVSADGLRVVDEKTKVSCCLVLSQH